VNVFEIIYYGASWCAPCEAYGPIFDSVAESTFGPQFRHYDVDVQTEEALADQIDSLPTTIAKKEDGELFRYVGVMSADSLRQFITQAMAA
jgi:thioredoxin 1